MRGGEGPPGAVSIWAWSPSIFGRPLNLVLYMPFRIFAYSSNIIKANFDLMDCDVCFRDLEVGRLSCKSFSFRDLLTHDPSLGTKCSF